MTETAEDSGIPYPLMDDGTALTGDTPPEETAGEQMATSPEILPVNAMPSFPQEAEIDYYGLALVFLAPALGQFLYDMYLCGA